MMSTSNQNDHNGWNVGLIRATVFIESLSAEDAINNTWLEETIGEKPDEVLVNNQKQMSVQKSLFHDNILTMTCQSKRVDWTLEAAENASKMSELSTLGPMSDNTLKPFVGIVEKWLDKCPPTNRLAFGSHLGRVTNSIHAGYETLQKYLPDVKLDPQNTADFLYKINRPRKSREDSNITINCLNMWSVELLSTGGVTIDPATSKISTNLQNVPICKLELDINTVFLDDAIENNKTRKIFQELVEYGLEISIKGDVK